MMMMMIGLAVFSQMTAECPYRAYFTMGRPSPSKLPLPMGDLYPNLIHDSLGPPEA